FSQDPVFGFEVPGKVEDVPSELLSPRKTWSDAAAYDAQARRLATMFRENFEQYRADVPSSVAAAGPA
ncbi:MAG: phosphoenolpyruvate carboxykinase (ATP), partial [Gemmatimonadales bacterium]